MDELEPDIATLLGPNAGGSVPAFEAAVTSAARASYRYVFVSQDAYQRLLFEDRNVAVAAQVYWTEMVERMHVAAVATLMRTQRWLAGSRAAVQTHNYLAFASSFRGLIEAAADSCHVLGLIPELLAKNWKYVKLALAGRAPFLLQDPAFEDRLIHFIMARKTAKTSQVPDSYRALHPREYLHILQGTTDGPLTDCYAELCQLTHPAMESVMWLFSSGSGGCSLELKCSPDSEAIADFCGRHSNLGPYVLLPPFFWSIAALRLANRLGIAGLDMPFAELCQIDATDEWQRISALLDVYEGRDADDGHLH